MNRIMKDGDDAYVVFDEDKKLIARIRKNAFGTHGHWRGWRHYCYCKQYDKLVFAGADIPINGMLSRWTDAPMIFANIKEAKDYYGIN